MVGLLGPGLEVASDNSIKDGEMDALALEVLTAIHDLQFNGRQDPDRKRKWEEIRTTLKLVKQEQRERSNYIVRLDPVPMVALRAEFFDRDVDLDRECRLLEVLGGIRRTLEPRFRETQYLRRDGKLVKLGSEFRVLQLGPDQAPVELVDYVAYVDGQWICKQDAHTGPRPGDKHSILGKSRAFQIEAFSMEARGFELLKPGASLTLGGHPEPLVRLSQVLPFTGVKERQLERWVKDGTIPPPDVGGGKGNVRLWYYSRLRDALRPRCPRMPDWFQTWDSMS